MTDKVRTVDFDAFRAEQEKHPVFIKIGGQQYALPDALPASMALGIIRLKADVGEDGEIPEIEVDKFGRAVFGSKIWDEILDEHRLTVDEMPILLQKVLEVYTGEAPKVPASPTSPKKPPASAS